MKMNILKSGLRVFAFLAAGYLIGMFAAKGLKAQDKSLLWEISGKGLEKPSYLYGTIHMICPDELFVTDATKEAVANSEQIVMELDMDDPSLMQRMQQQMMNPGMSNFSDQLSEEDKETINEFLKKNYGADLSQLGIMKPFGLLSMVLIKGLDCPQPGSYEATFVQMKGEKELHGLETVERQIKVFDDIPMEEQIQWLVDYTGDTTILVNEIDEMTAVYKEQDITKLHDIITDSPQYQKYAAALLYERNEEWIPVIEKFISEKPSFIAVGAGHLGSEKGVVALLQDAGYTVKPLN